MKLSKRDRNLMALLAKYEVLSSVRIRQQFFSTTAETNFYRRLRELESARFLKRIGPLSDHSFAWSLGNLGREMLGVFNSDAQRNRMTIEHDVALAEVRMGLESLGFAKDFQSERELRRRVLDLRTKYSDKRKELVPDAIFPVMRGNEGLKFALECELSLKNRQRYQDLFYRYYCENSIKSIWYVTRTKVIGQAVVNEFHRFYLRHQPSYRAFQNIGYTELEDFQRNPLHAQIHYADSKGWLIDWFYLRPPENRDQSPDQWLNQQVIDDEINCDENNECA